MAELSLAERAPQIADDHDGYHDSSTDQDVVPRPAERLYAPFIHPVCRTPQTVPEIARRDAKRRQNGANDQAPQKNF